MATDNYKIVIDVDSKSAEKNVSRMEGVFGGLKKGALSLTAGLAATGVAALALGKQMVSAAADMEQQEVAFKTLLGSQEQAIAFLKEARELAAKTPFETKDITKAAQTMLAFGVATKDVIPNIKMIGDVALGNKEKFDSLSLAFSQVQSAGKLTGQDLLQMVNQGFNPLQIMSEKSGKSMAQLRDEMSKGAISAEMVTQAFKDATSEGGRFFGGMEAQSTTFTGLVSTLTDAWNTFLQGEGQKILEWAKEIVKWLTIFIQNVLPEIVKKLEEVKQKISEFLPTGEEFKTFFENLKTTFLGLITTVAESSKKFEEKTGILAQLKSVVVDLWSRIQTSLVPAFEKLWVAIQPLMPYFEAFAKLLAASFILTLKALVEVLGVIAGWFIEIIAKLVEFAAFVINDAKPKIELMTSFFNALAESIGWVISKFNDFVSAAKKASNSVKEFMANNLPGGSLVFGGARADGGPVSSGTPYLVGERGPEMFVPRSSGTIIPNDQMGNKVSIMEGANISVRNDNDIQLLANAVASQLARTLEARRSGLATAS